MNESIGSAGVFYVMITFISVLALFFVGATNYSRAFKVKNRIVEEIEKYGSYNDQAAVEIEDWLDGKSDDSSGMGGIGYKKRTGNTPVDCEEYGDGAIQPKTLRQYEYCVFEIDTCDIKDDSTCGKYYKVVAFMFFDLPLMESFYVPVKGETMIFRNKIKSDYEYKIEGEYELRSKS